MKYALIFVPKGSYPRLIERVSGKMPLLRRSRSVPFFQFCNGSIKLLQMTPIEVDSYSIYFRYWLLSSNPAIGLPVTCLLPRGNSY